MSVALFCLTLSALLLLPGLHDHLWAQAGSLVALAIGAGLVLTSMLH